jgi:multimeric flavodoxin WrbA
MKTVILFGSPRKDGNTIQLTGAFSRGLKEKGCDVRTIYLNDLNIRPCQGCLTCLPTGICKINDDMKDIRKYIAESDLIVYATPVYWFAPSSQLKVVIDRSIAFLDTEYNSRIKGKKAITIMTCADESSDTFSPSKDMFRRTFDLLAISYAGSVEATGCTEKGVVKDESMEKAVKLAKSLL